MVGAEGVIGWFDAAGPRADTALPSAVHTGPVKAGPSERLRESHITRTSQSVH
jgi:hypothetical protein